MEGQFTYVLTPHDKEDALKRAVDAELYEIAALIRDEKFVRVTIDPSFFPPDEGTDGPTFTTTFRIVE